MTKLNKPPKQDLRNYAHGFKNEAGPGTSGGIMEW